MKGEQLFQGMKMLLPLGGRAVYTRLSAFFDLLGNERPSSSLCIILPSLLIKKITPQLCIYVGQSLLDFHLQWCFICLCFDSSFQVNISHRLDICPWLPGQGVLAGVSEGDRWKK